MGGWGGGGERMGRGVEVYIDCALLLCFVMGYVVQFGEIEHKIVPYYYHHYYHCYYNYFLLPS